MIIIQSDSDRKLPHHFDAACAMYGAIENCEDYRLTSFEEIQSGKLNTLLRINCSCAVGSTEFLTEVFKNLGKTNVRLPRNSNRVPFSNITTLKEAHQSVAEGKKLFIKPYEIKLFTGLVLDGADYTCLRGLPDDTLVLAYEPFKSNLISEWRIYIHNDQMIDARHYSGEFTVAPDWHYVREVIKSNAGFPVAYTIDIGILERAESHNTYEGIQAHNNIVVEFNDMWAIGNYGMPNDLYMQCLKDRYQQIINS